MSDRETGDLPADLVEECLKTFHGAGSWRLIKQQWPEVAVSERRRKMGEVIVLAQNATDVAVEVRRHSPGKDAVSNAEQEPNAWKETVRAIYDAMHHGDDSVFEGQRRLARKVVAMIEERHSDYFCGRRDEGYSKWLAKFDACHHEWEDAESDGGRGHSCRKCGAFVFGSIPDQPDTAP